MNDSILTSTKKMVGIEADYTAFDLDIINHINTVFTVLTQLGVGPSLGFMIEDDTSTWSEFIGTDPRLNSVKTYVYLRVRLLFDPPTTSYLINAMQEQINMLEWRLNVTVDSGSTTSTQDDVLVWEIDDHEPFPEDAVVGDVGFDPVTGDVWRNT